MQHDENGKIAYALLMASQKLRHYFEAHKIRVATDQSPSDLFSNLEIQPVYFVYIQNKQVGNRALRIPYSLRVKKFNQVTSPYWLYSTLDKAFAFSSPIHGNTLDNPLRWRMVSRGDQCSSSNFSPVRRQLQISHPPEFCSWDRQVYQQHSIVRSSHSRTPQTQGARH